MADKAHDVWALGVVLYVMATKKFPWRAAKASDREFARFLRGDFTAAPWSTLSPPLLQARAAFHIGTG